MIPKAIDLIYSLIQYGKDGIKFSMILVVELFKKSSDGYLPVYQTFYLRTKAIHLLSSQKKTEIEKILIINRENIIKLKKEGILIKLVF